MMEHYVTLYEVTPTDIQQLLEVAVKLKVFRKSRKVYQPLPNASVALLFEKPSLRTRVTFEIAIAELGARPIYLGPQEVGLGKRETVADVSRNLSRWVHAIVVRTFKHDALIELAYTADVPVINALTDREHPCQALGDILTILEHKQRLKGVTLAFVGDGGNNVCHALMYAASKTGMHMRIACPRGFEPLPDVFTHAKESAALSGGSLRVSHDPVEAVRGADAVYTDVWVSMGFEDQSAQRQKAFTPFRVDAALMSNAASDAIFLHCLPARRGEEVTDDVLDGKQSAVLDQAENRLHSAKAVLLAVMAPGEFQKFLGTKQKKSTRRK